MIRFIIARHNDVDYEKYLLPSLNNLDVISYEIKDENGEKLSLTQKYNIGIDAVLKENLNDNDIVIFCHEDVELKDPYFSEKMNMVFEKDNVGLVGVIGANEFTNNGMWWANTPDKLNGHILQEINGNDNHLVKGNIGFFDNIVAIDGLMFAIKGKLLNNGLKFDKRFNFHHYDIDICFQVLKRNYDVCVADILVKHKSQGIGSLTEEYKISKNFLIEKWNDYNFPINKLSFRSK